MGKHRKINPGDVLESLEVIENLGYRKYGNENTTFWKCRCLKCGNIVDVPSKTLGRTQKDCGCGRHNARKPIQIGEQFGRLKVIGDRILEPGRGYKYLCECSCKKHKQLYVRGDGLRSGEAQSCGCIHDELFQKHTDKGMSTRGQGTRFRILNDELQKNNTSGVRGVSWHTRVCKWQARIVFQGKGYHLGYFDKLEDATEARETAENHLYKDFKEWYAEQYPDKWDKIQEKSNSQIKRTQN